MTKKIRWLNIIPKSIQRLQARYYAWRDVFIKTDYHYNDKPEQDLLSYEKKQKNKDPSIKKLITISLTIIFIFIIFIFIIPLLLI